MACGLWQPPAVISRVQPAAPTFQIVVDAQCSAGCFWSITIHDVTKGAFRLSSFWIG